MRDFKLEDIFNKIVEFHIRNKSNQFKHEFSLRIVKHSAVSPSSYKRKFVNKGPWGWGGDIHMHMNFRNIVMSVRK